MKNYQLVERLLQFPDQDTVAVCDALGYPHTPEAHRPEHDNWTSFGKDTTILLSPRDAPAAELVATRTSQELSFSAFQTAATELAVYPHAGEGDVRDITIALNGLAGEAGKALHIWHKPLRGDAELDAEMRIAIAGHLGDILWYAASLSKAIGIPLSQTAAGGLRKARSRKTKTESKQAQGSWLES